MHVQVLKQKVGSLARKATDAAELAVAGFAGKFSV